MPDQIAINQLNLTQNQLYILEAGILLADCCLKTDKEKARFDMRGLMEMTFKSINGRMPTTEYEGLLDIVHRLAHPDCMCPFCEKWKKEEK